MGAGIGSAAKSLEVDIGMIQQVENHLVHVI